MAETIYNIVVGMFETTISPAIPTDIAANSEVKIHIPKDITLDEDQDENSEISYNNYYFTASYPPPVLLTYGWLKTNAGKTFIATLPSPNLIVFKEWVSDTPTNKPITNGGLQIKKMTNRGNHIKKLNWKGNIYTFH